MTKLICAGLLMAALGCSHESKQQPVTRLPANTPDGPVIVHVVSRHQTVTISASKRGPLYSVKNEQGKVMVAGATLQELARDYPELYRQIAPAMAKDQPTDSKERAGSFRGTANDQIMMDDARR